MGLLAYTANKLLLCAFILISQDIKRVNTIMEPIVLVHGGAGDIISARVPAKLSGVKKSALKGYEILENGGSVVDAVEAAVKIMEDDEAFNAGYGSVLNLDGEVEMDALIMDGAMLNAGAVTVVKDIANPISLARLVMEKTRHVLFAGEGANKLAKEFGIPQLPPGALISPHAKAALEHYKKTGYVRSEIGPEEKVRGEVGTVGAVAIDIHGNLASATSTGGTNGKMVGRSSDTSLIGSGGYADNDYGAVSTTGHGESIAKYCLAHTIINNIALGQSANNATKEAIRKMTAKLNNTAGAITLSSKGEIGIDFSSKRMAWAYRKGNEVHFGIEPNQDEMETVN